MYHQFKKSSFGSNRLNILLAIFIISGIALRIFHFIYNRSLWMDEVYLATSLIKYNYHELIHSPLYYEQKAPIGFLLCVKLIVNIFGKNEYALRLIPLFSGIISLFLFIPVGKYFLSKPALVLALGILCFSPALIYHAVEIKQYAIELLATLAALYTFIRFEHKKSLITMVIWGLMGGLLIWFSYSVIFILAGIAISLCLYYIASKKWSCLFRNAVAFSIWLFVFLINYLLFTHKHAESSWITYWFRSYGNFMPFPPNSLNDLKWFPLVLYRMLDYPLGLLWPFFNMGTSKALNIVLKMPLIPIFLLTAGSYCFISKDKLKAALLFIPIFLTLLASGLELYPLTERFWVFIAPFFILIIAKGYEYILLKINKKLVTYLLLILALLPSLVQSAFFIIHPENFYVHKKSFEKEALQYVDENYKENDGVYVYWNNLPGYRLYKIMYPFKFDAIEGRDVRKISKSYHDYYTNLNTDFQHLKGHHRIWIIFNHKYLTDIGDLIDQPAWYYQNNPTDQLILQLNKMGAVTQKYNSTDISVYLIETRDQ